MNLRSLVAYTSDTLITVKVRFSRTGAVYRYLATRAMGETVKQAIVCAGCDVPVIVEQDETFKVAYAMGVDDHADVNFNSDLHYCWLVGMVDLAERDKLEEQMRVEVEQLETRRRAHLRKQIIENLAKDPMLTGFGDIPGAEDATPAPATSGRPKTAFENAPGEVRNAPSQVPFPNAGRQK